MVISGVVCLIGTLLAIRFIPSMVDQRLGSNNEPLGKID
jgi:hypothetical protein